MPLINNKRTANIVSLYQVELGRWMKYIDTPRSPLRGIVPMIGRTRPVVFEGNLILFRAELFRCCLLPEVHYNLVQKVCKNS